MKPTGEFDADAILSEALRAKRGIENASNLLALLPQILESHAKLEREALKLQNDLKAENGRREFLQERVNSLYEDYVALQVKTTMKSPLLSWLHGLTKSS